MSDYKIRRFGGYLDIEIPKGKSREELKDMAVRIHEDLKKAGIGFGELTEEHRKEMREIAKELGCKEVKEK